MKNIEYQLVVLVESRVDGEVLVVVAAILVLIILLGSTTNSSHCTSCATSTKNPLLKSEPISLLLVTSTLVVCVFSFLNFNAFTLEL